VSPNGPRHHGNSQCHSSAWTITLEVFAIWMSLNDVGDLLWFVFQYDFVFELLIWCPTAGSQLQIFVDAVSTQ